MKLDSFELSKSWIIAAVVGLTIGLAVFFLASGFFSANELKTYRNDRYGLSFEYPSNWKLEEQSVKQGNGLINLTINSSEDSSNDIGILAGDLSVLEAFEGENSFRRSLENLKKERENISNTVFLEGPKDLVRNGVGGFEYRQLIPSLGYRRIMFFSSKNHSYLVRIWTTTEFYENYGGYLDHIAETFTPKENS